MTPVCSESEIDTCLADTGYIVEDRFPSVVVADYMRTACETPDLNVDITKATRHNKPNMCIELFTPTFESAGNCWLRTAQKINHIAFKPIPVVSFSMLCNEVEEYGFIPTLKGANPYAHHLSPALDGVTIQYYSALTRTGRNPLAIEICTYTRDS